MQNKYVEKEWHRLQKAEESFLKKNMPAKADGWQEKAARYVPEKLEGTLNTSFYKAFELIFEKGTAVIEKTCQKEKKEQNYKINEYAADVRQNSRALRAFGKEANASKALNMAFSTVEGVGMGLLGMGIPDIPVFLGMLLKSIYETALSYGFSYDTEEEQIFILKIIETALLHEDALEKGNSELNQWMHEKETEKAKQHQETRNTDEVDNVNCKDGKQADGTAGEMKTDRQYFENNTFHLTREEQIRRTADALSKEMLYLKFVQGMPVVGVVGGLSDIVYQKKISDYAGIKYKRRFLEKKRK